MRVSRALSTGKIDSVTGETKGAGVWTGPWEDKTGLLEVKSCSNVVLAFGRMS